MGGLLSAYELDGKKNQKLVDQAKIVGDHLLQGWVGDNDLPFNTLLNWDNFGSPNVSTGAIIAETGSEFNLSKQEIQFSPVEILMAPFSRFSTALVLEFYKLSKYTGNSTYADHADRSMKATANAKGPFPGLKGQGLEPMTNEPTDDYVSWGGGSDSYFEVREKNLQESTLDLEIADHQSDPFFPSPVPSKVRSHARNHKDLDPTMDQRRRFKYRKPHHYSRSNG